MADESNLPPVIDNDGHTSTAPKRPRIATSISPIQQSRKDHQSSELNIQEDLQGCKYIEVVCGGRTGKLVLDKFCKLERNKGYDKCVEYNNKLVLPQELEVIGGMKAMKCWKNL